MPNKINLGLLLNGENLLFSDIIDISRQAVESGVESIWTSELGRDAFTPLGAIATVTQNVRLGTAIATFARPPAYTESAAMTIAELTNENFILGLGTAPSKWNSDWHGLEVTNPVGRMREYVSCIRKMWTSNLEHTINFQGEFINVKNYGRFLPAPSRKIPIYLAAVQKKMLRLSGEIADGLLANTLNTPNYFSDIVMPNVEIGMQRRDRSNANFEFATLKVCSVDEDSERARNLSKQTIAFYSTLPYFDIVLDPAGFLNQKENIRALFSEGKIEEMADAVTDDMVAKLALAGTPSEIISQIKPFEGLINTMILVSPVFGLTQNETKANLQQMMNIFSKY